ncbi:hypothetical protein I79_013550 [Cricetulus griseus]|uniref:Uncharacterized protein n=1 Tax=Cricetulus griseus TaxID=10029 RepID=G3HRS8_CRIGR|nr:hypothetical protein I79_013550 [Cricetulus griseus]
MSLLPASSQKQAAARCTSLPGFIGQDFASQRQKRQVREIIGPTVRVSRFYNAGI